MPVIVFETEDNRSVEIAVPEGGPLVDVCDEHSTPVPFSCRGASCGTCCVHVLEGADLLDPPLGDELEVLDALGESPARARLACQACIHPGPGRLRLRVPAY